MCLCLALIICKPLALTMYLFTSYFPGYFDRLVSAVYNLAYIQALFHVSCKFNDEEKKSWLTRTPSARSRDGSTSQYQCNLLPVVLKPLMTVGFYPPDDATTSVSSPLPHFHIKNSWIFIYFNFEMWSIHLMGHLYFKAMWKPEIADPWDSVSLSRTLAWALNSAFLFSPPLWLNQYAVFFWTTLAKP